MISLQQQRHKSCQKEIGTQETTTYGSGQKRADKEEEKLNGYINLPYVRNISEALRRIFKNHQIRCTFYASETLRKLISHPKDHSNRKEK